MQSLMLHLLIKAEKGQKENSSLLAQFKHMLKIITFKGIKGKWDLLIFFDNFNRPLQHKYISQFSPKYVQGIKLKIYIVVADLHITKAEPGNALYSLCVEYNENPYRTQSYSLR